MRKKETSLVHQFQNAKADYTAAKTSQYRRIRSGVTLSGSNADYHYRSESDYLRMMEYARDMQRNDLVVPATVGRAVLNTVQNGFGLDPKTGDEALNDDLRNYWDSWTSDPEECDIAGESTFADFEDQVLTSNFVDGDIFAHLTDAGSIELIEAHRCRTPNRTKRNIIHGVQMDDFRRREQYYFTKKDIAARGNVLLRDLTAVPARDDNGDRRILHIYQTTQSHRPTQTRGVTAFAPMFDALGMFEDLNFAKLVQAQVVSCFAIFRKRPAEVFRQTAKPAQVGSRTTSTRSDSTTRTVENMAPGMTLSGEPGEELQGFSPGVPNPEFFPHVRLILTLIGVNLGMPLVLVLLDASETNFSGWRGAIDQARLGFRKNQKRLSGRFHARVYKWKLRQWIDNDPTLRRSSLKADIDIFKHEWIMPTWPYIEPLKDASADLLRVRNGLTSRRRRAQERGDKWPVIAREMVEDNALAIRLAKTEAKKMNDEYSEDDPVHWRELLNLPTPDGVKVNIDAGKPEAPNAAE